MRTTNKAVLVIFSFFLLVTISTGTTYAQNETSTVLFTGWQTSEQGNWLHRLPNDSTEPERVGYVPRVAYVDFGGGALYSVNQNVVKQIYPAGINPSRPTRMVFQWLPDSSGVIYSVFDDPSINGLTYGGTLEVSAEFASVWPWLACDQIMQNRQTGRPGLVCGYPSDAPRVEMPEQVVVHWDQEPVPFNASDYLPLVGQPGQPLPPYAWFRDDEQETIIFYGSVAANTSPDFHTVSTGTAVRTLLPPDPGRQSAFDISSDHQRIAVISRNTNSDGLWVDCARVYSIATGALTWGGEDEACSPAFADPATGGFTEVAWYPNMNQIVIAGRSPEQGAYLRRVNLDSGEDTLLLQGYELIENLFVSEVSTETSGS